MLKFTAFDYHPFLIIFSRRKMECDLKCLTFMCLINQAVAMSVQVAGASSFISGSGAVFLSVSGMLL